MKRAKKADAPVLFLGLGGTGLDMLLTVKSKFHDYFEAECLPNGEIGNKPPHTESCLIDSDPYDNRRVINGVSLDPSEICEEFSAYLKPAHFAMITKPYVSQWWDSCFDMQMHSYSTRQVSRLHLFCNYDNVCNILEHKLRHLAASYPVQNALPVAIKVFASVSGNTGGGLLLDIAYILKDIARRNAMRISMEAYLIMPDVTINLFPGLSSAERLFPVNGYALLKELDYWMDAEKKRQTDGATVYRYELGDMGKCTV